MRNIVCPNCNHHIPDMTSDQKFWNCVNKLGTIPDSSKKCIGNCWEWTGPLTKNGYGTFSGVNRMTAHRKSYVIKFGLIPKGMLVCHKCDNRKCINPDHLFIGTHQDNMKDMVSKGRSKYQPAPLGELNPVSKLTNNDIRQIMKLNEDGMSSRAIAKVIGVSYNAICMVLLGRTWSHITGYDCKPIFDGQSRGSDHPNAILTEEKVKNIRDDYAKGKKFYISYYALGKKYGVAGGTIRDVCKRYRWKHV